MEDKVVVMQEQDRTLQQMALSSMATEDEQTDSTQENSDGYFEAGYLVLASFCGASTVAIDNKIEQAMDLVKSHLMYAVREEVEVLREQIKELLEKNSQLEYENQILKKHANPETLAKLQQPRPHSIAPPPTTSS